VGAVALAAFLVLSGCSMVRGLFGGRPGTLPPAAKLYEEGEGALLRGKYALARDSLVRLVERHPDSELVPQARLLLGESYYREQEYDRAIREFEQFMTLFPGHAAADLGQYRLARSHFDQMPTLERDQALTARALAEFRKLIKQYPESRYAPDAIAKIEACRLRLAQKELWVAAYYVRQGKLEAALQRYDAVLKDYARTAATPQALFEKADALVRLGRTDEATTALRRLVEEHPGNEWSRRARQRHAQLL
jgi:outer membrane protein assembly factor BamD